MLSSAAIATAAALGMTTNGGQESDFDINELVRRLQILTRVDYVSFVSPLSHIVNEELETTRILKTCSCNRPVEQNLKDHIHQDYLVSCINEMHENLGVESRESLRRDSEHLDQSSRDSSDTTIPTWEGKEPESKSKVVEERENASGLKSSTPTEMFGVVDYLYST